MSGYTPFLVAAAKTGLDLGLDPWLIPEDAYLQAIDGYNFRGVFYKRAGYTWEDSVPHTLPGLYQNIFKFGTTVNALVDMTAPHGLAVGSTFIVRFHDIFGLTSPAGLPSVNGTRWVATVTGANTFTINNDQPFGGAHVGGTGTASYFPGNPVMCIATWVDETNTSITVVLDTKRASRVEGTLDCLIPLGVSDIFTGTNRDYFYWENYRGRIYFTNNVDSMFIFGNAPTFSDAVGLLPFLPEWSAGNAVTKALMIKAIGSRLCLFNTEEGGVRLPTRVRWCQDGADPYPGTGASNPWDEVNPGHGYNADLLDTQYIISLAKSQTNTFLLCRGQQFGTVYEMRPISDPRNAFAFVNVGNSRNFNSTFGTIILDKLITSVGDTGLILTDGNNVTRYDDKIPDFVLNDIDQENINRCYGQRNDLLWQTWMLYPSNAGSVSGLNDSVLVYNYQDNGWSVYRMDLCCLGTIINPKSDPACIDYGTNLPDWSSLDFGDDSWASTFQAQSPMLVGGDYMGNVWKMDTGGGDAADNVAYLQPVNNGQPITMELASRQWFPYAKQAKSAQFGFVDLLVEGDADTDVTVSFQVDNQGSNYLTTTFTPYPYENVLLAQIQGIVLGNPTQVFAPNHQLNSGDIVFVYGVQGTYQLNDNAYTVTVVDIDNFTLNVDSTTFGAYVSGGYLSATALNSSPFWLRIYSGQTGVFHQMKFTSTGVDESFALHAVMPHFKPAGRIYR